MGIFMRDCLPHCTWRAERGVINLNTSSGPEMHWTTYQMHWTTYDLLQPRVIAVSGGKELKNLCLRFLLNMGFTVRANQACPFRYIKDNGERSEVCISTKSHEVVDIEEYLKQELGQDITVKLHSKANTLHSKMYSTSHIDFT
ncbi:hypothetical protein PR048_002567 [Dryococelus australis]|uniref:Uncharacterized protein n=1 Tax=Dryococelus australis TaxID=614101 RepID=A0ABQ9IKN3_9NEOP|nr:hypothetical protein PR048_002567 [Dryococelus australis]